MVKLNKIYTRTGDDGSTGLVDGSRIAKHDALMDAIGTVDETNSAIGLAIAAMVDTETAAVETAMLRRIQNDLFDLGADLATPGDDFAPSVMTLRIVTGQCLWLEQQIDRINADLPALASFILPGGTETAARIQLARAIARRAERNAAAAHVRHGLNPQALIYLNRLSDLLFVLARRIMRDHGGDILWVPGASR